MKRSLIALASLVACALLSIPFIGWQTRGYRDANESPTAMWEPFVKQRLTLQVLYSNPLDCGVCEERSLGDLDADGRLELTAVCQDRYGLTSLADCARRLK